MPSSSIPSFPLAISLTVTNACNLRCQMCGQWSEEGYVRDRDNPHNTDMTLADWKRVVDEAADHGVREVLIRGGEPFMMPGLIELIEHVRGREIALSIDTNGTLLSRYADDLVRIGNLHLTVSMDGPEPIHDEVRGVRDTYRRVKDGLAGLAEAEARAGATGGAGGPITRALCFTISPYSYRGLPELPDVARELGVDTILIVPYYYVPERLGREYERELTELGGEAFSWRGFHHEDSGVDAELFLELHRQYRERLGSVREYPYLRLSEDEYRTWFADPVARVGIAPCHMPERFLDIQPNGAANFCVDFPDFAIGNVRDETVERLWNGERARAFRERRAAGPLAVCHRCGAKYMAEPVTSEG